MFHIAVFSILVIVAVLGTIGNLLIIGAVCLQRRLRTRGNAFIVNLAVTDLIITAVVMPLGLAQSQNQQRIFGDLVCDLNAFVILTTCGVSTQTLMMIAVERYIHVCRMELYKKLYTPVLLGVYITFTWLYTMAWTVHGWTGWTKFVYGKDVYLCLFSGPASLSYDICLAVFGMLIPMIVIFVSYYLIFRFVRLSKTSLESYKKNKRDSGASTTELFNKHERRAEKERKLTATLFTIVILFVIFWIPAAVVLISAGFWKTMPKILYVISVWVALCNSCVNSIVYGIMNKKFQRGYAEILRKFVCCKGEKDPCRCTTVESSTSRSDSALKYGSGSLSRPRKSNLGSSILSNGTFTKINHEKFNNNNVELRHVRENVITETRM